MTLQRPRAAFPLVVLATVFSAGCAPLYLQPPAAGNATVYFEEVGDVKLTSIQHYLDGRDCSNRLRVTPEEARGMAAGNGIVLHAGREFGVTLEATRSIKREGTVYRSEVCQAVVSFTPQADMSHRVRFEATQAGCAIRVTRVAASGVETPEPTARQRQWNSPLTGSACKPG